MNKWEQTAEAAWKAILDRVRGLKNDGYTLQQIADMLKVKNRSLIGEWLNGNREAANAPFSNLMGYLENLGLNYEDFFPLHEASIKRPAPYAPEESSREHGMAEIAVYSVAGAGPAWEITEREPLSVIHAPLAYIEQCTLALLIDGQSMEPTIRNGGVVGVKTDTDFKNGEIYAIRLPYEGLAVKRVLVDYKTGEYIIRSDNPDKNRYEDIRLPLDEDTKLIVGRVVWIWQVC